MGDADATCRGLVARLRAQADPANVAGMARFGIRGRGILGVPKPALRALAKGHRRDHALAAALWATGLHEARVLAALVEDPAAVTGAQMEAWVRDFDDWDLCDQCCLHLFDRVPGAWEKARELADAPAEFARRAGLVIIAATAAHDKVRPDGDFRAVFPLLERAADDGRNFVKKAVSWAIRHMAKRRAGLRRDCAALARRIAARGNPAARWVAADVLREIQGAPPGRSAIAVTRGRR